MSLCASCAERAKESGFLTQLRRLANRGAWLCPFSKPQCGTKTPEPTPTEGPQRDDL